MVGVALLPGVALTGVIFVVVTALSSVATGASAALGIGVVLINFLIAGLSLAWAAEISLVALTAVALGGWLVRLGLFFGILALLDLGAWFSPLAFALAGIPAFLALLVAEALLVLKGMGGRLTPGGAGTPAAKIAR